MLFRNNYRSSYLSCSYYNNTIVTQEMMRVLKQFQGTNKNKQTEQPINNVIPDNVQELVDYLDLCYPPQLVRPGDSHDKIMFYAGQRSLVEWIKLKIKQKETS